MMPVVNIAAAVVTTVMAMMTVGESNTTKRHSRQKSDEERERPHDLAPVISRRLL